MNYRNQPNQLGIKSLSIKKLFLTGLAVVVGLILSITFLTSWEDVLPGQEGFIYRPYNGGFKTDEVYSDGTYFIAPWNTVICYNTRQESKTYTA